MNANDHMAREELARAHHLIWSTRRFRRKSGETVGRLIERMKRLLEEHEPEAVMASRAPPRLLGTQTLGPMTWLRGEWR